MPTLKNEETEYELFNKLMAIKIKFKDRDHVRRLTLIMEKSIWEDKEFGIYPVADSKVIAGFFSWQKWKQNRRIKNPTMDGDRGKFTLGHKSLSCPICVMAREHCINCLLQGDNQCEMPQSPYQLIMLKGASSKLMERTLLSLLKEKTLEVKPERTEAVLKKIADIIALAPPYKEEKD